MDFKSYELEIKEAASDSGFFYGYASVFGSVDSWGDVIHPGSFSRTLQEYSQKKRMPPLLWQHDTAAPIGPIEELSEDSRGLTMRARLLIGDVPKASEAHALLKNKVLSGLSIGFIPKKRDYDDVTGIRNIYDVDLYEVSLVTFPAHDSARVTSVKSANFNALSDFERYLREAGFSRENAKGFVSELKSFISRHNTPEIDAYMLDSLTNLFKEVPHERRNQSCTGDCPA